MKNKIVIWFVSIKIIRKILQKLILIGSSNKNIYSDQTIFSRKFLRYINKTSTSLDIGSGPTPKNPFMSDVLYGTDFRANEKNNVIYSDLSLGNLPFENEKFDFITAYDVLEHIPRVMSINGRTTFPLILLMNEVFRVLKPGGIFFSIQPVYPSKSVFQDPTHVNIMSEDTIDFYFCSKAWARIYGYEGSFEMLDDGWIEEKYFSFIKKSVNDSIKDLEFIQE